MHLLGWCLIPELLVSPYLNTLIITWLWFVCWLDPMLLVLSGTGDAHYHPSETVYHRLGLEPSPNPQYLVAGPSEAQVLDV